jgi:uncharacterized glyoxalase superfamily protein PhnB
MSDAAKSATQGAATIIPAVRYKDAAKAIEFLCAAFGFAKHAVHEGEKGSIAHAQLTLGNGMVMLGSASNEGEYGSWVKPPERPFLVNTQGLYVVVADVDAHHAIAQAAGAKILIAPKDEDYGGRSYTARDPEGHVWTFGSYDPFA